MTQDDKNQCINYATRIAVLVQGCTSATCPFAVGSRIGTANLCRCGDEVRSLVDALSEKVQDIEKKRSRQCIDPRLKIAVKALDEISSGVCCQCCQPGDPQCDVGTAKDALREIKDAGKELAKVRRSEVGRGNV